MPETQHEFGCHIHNEKITGDPCPLRRLLIAQQHGLQ